ncbi:MAG: acetoacetate--CoA ligase [Gaiellales bacterium]
MSSEQPPPILWRPTSEQAGATHLAGFVDWLESERGLRFAGYEQLWRWSVDELPAFWEAVWDYFEVRAHAPYRAVLGSRAMPGAEWFPGAELNYAEHVFRGRDPGSVAIWHSSESGPDGELTWAELRALAARIAAGLRAEGVGPGDRVVAYLPNIPEAAAALLAAASIGAVWSSCSPDFGARAVIDRFAQVEPVVLLTIDGCRYGGRTFDRLEVVRELEAAIPSLRRTVVLPSLGEDARARSLRRGLGWEEFCGDGDAPLEFTPVPFDHPLWILYSSGTTGLPKAIVQGQGGILLEQLKHLHLHVDAHPGDRLFWFTTTGWMMWNFLLGGLLTGAAVVLYDGSPGYPAPDALWELAERAGITCFGTSAAYLASCREARVDPRSNRELRALRAVGSTGSPLGPEVFDWVYERLGPDVWLFSTSGGSDVCTAFLSGCPILPVSRGEIQARALGCKVEAWDADGRSVVDQVGELVITEPMPSMPLRFWNDPSGARYRASYFETYPGVWRHGDWLELTSRGTAIISGRSDSTINRGGVRIGTGEIYSAVSSVPRIVDALVVDVPREGAASQIHLFVVLQDGDELDEGLERALRERIRMDCSPRHVPDVVHQAPEVPRTLSGKLLEVPVKRILTGSDPDTVATRDALANPGSLDWYAELAGRL